MSKINSTLLIVLIYLNKESKAQNQPNANTEPSEIQQKSLPHNPKRLVLNFVPENLAKAVTELPFVVVLFTKENHPEDKKATNIFLRLAKNMQKSKITFLRVDISSTSGGKTVATEDQIVSLYLYVEGGRRHFNGELAFEDILLWIKAAFSARPFKIANLSDIERADSHYLVYADFKWVMKNKKKVRALAKLLAPLGIYTGLSAKSIKKLRNADEPKPPLFWTKRAYDKQLFSIDPKSSLEELVKTILDHELPESAVCNHEALMLVQETRIPVLAYFSSAGEKNGDQNWQAVLKAAKDFKEFLLPIVIREQELTENACSRFLKNYLEVESWPALRILIVADKVKRFAHVGGFDEKSLKFFLNNYIEGNLKSYAINEKLGKGDEFFGISKANSKSLKTLTRGSNSNNLIYVHGEASPGKEKHLKVLNELKKEFENQPRFKIFSLDNDKNDLNRSFNHLHLPFVFFITSEGRLLGYKKPITKKYLSSFIESQFKFSKSEEISMTDL